MLGHRMAWWGSSKELEQGKKAKGQLLLQVSSICCAMISGGEVGWYRKVRLLKFEFALCSTRLDVLSI